MKKLIAFTGLAGSGKTTASNYLLTKLGGERINFKSGLIKEMKEIFPDFLKKEAEIYNCTIDELFNTKPGAFRQFMQNYGTELRRAADSEYWVKKWEELVIASTSDTIIVDDLRFLNEGQAIRNNHGIVIRIIKKGQENIMLHQSETEMNDILHDYIIEVEPGNVEELYRQLDDIF